jgi:hypothetical protein
VTGHDTADQKRRMLAWAARARANPRFEREEREHRLEVARLTMHVLEAAARSEAIGDRIEALHTYMRPRLPELVLPRQLAHLTAWATEDEAGLARALQSFNEASLAPGEQVARFAEALQAREPGVPGMQLSIALGSLFNFATAPGELPIVRPGVFAALAETLGKPPSAGTAAERYAQHLAFGREMQDTLAADGLPVRDQIDAEALILICWEDHEFWGSDDDGRRTRPRPPGHYLAACAIYRDEADYLAEWVEFHRLVGFERFYLYDNLSTDHHLEVLDPYVKEGIVVLHEWPQYPGQFAAYDHCVANYGDECRWIGFFDVDEFLFSPTFRPVSELLSEYEQWPGVGVNVPRFGTSGHRTKPDGLVIENYVVRIQTLAERTVKSIVDPAAVDRCRNAHEFFYRRRTAVDTDGFPIHGTATKSPVLDRLRANHYYTKSEEELRSKHTRRTADYARERRPLPDLAGLVERETELGLHDEAIVHYVRPLREALARRPEV